MSNQGSGSTFGRGMLDYFLGRVTIDDKPSIDLNQAVVTAATAIGAFFLGSKVVGPKVKGKLASGNSGGSDA